MRPYWLPIYIARSLKIFASDLRTYMLPDFGIVFRRMLSRNGCGRNGRKREAPQPTRRVIRRKSEAVRASARIKQFPDTPPDMRMARLSPVKAAAIKLP